MVTCCILFCNLLPPNFCLRIQDIRKFYIVFILWVYQSLYSPSSPPFFVAVNIFVKNTLLPRWVFVSICKGLWFSSAHLGLRSLRCACVTSPVRVYAQQNSQETKTVKSLTVSTRQGPGIWLKHGCPVGVLTYRLITVKEMGPNWQKKPRDQSFSAMELPRLWTLFDLM